MGDVPGWAYIVGLPLWAFALILAVRSFKDWPGIMGRWNERQRDRAQINSDQYRQLADRCSSLEKAEEQCRHELADKERRLAKLEGYAEGRGEAHQEAQMIVSTEREIDARKREGDK
jgi:hypothetical protein